MNTTGSYSSLGGLGAALQIGILTFEETKLIKQVLEAGVSTVLIMTSLLGNGLSTVVFYKMGYQDTMNISMTFICSVDFLRCFFSILFSLHYLFGLVSPVLTKSWYSIGSVTFYFWSIAGSFVSITYAAHISLERCLCVSIPYTVKDWLTPRVVWINNILITLIVFGSYLVIYSCYSITFRFDPELNATIAFIEFTPFYYENPQMRFYITFTSLGWTVLAVCVICVCTVIISYHLRQASKFKSTATQHQGRKGTQLSARDRQVIKMLLVIIAINMVVTIPRMVFNLAIAFVPSFFLFTKEHNFFEACTTIVVTLDFLNPATNFFIFYLMSSQFKKTCQKIFCSKSVNNINVKRPRCP